MRGVFPGRDVSPGGETYFFYQIVEIKALWLQLTFCKEETENESDFRKECRIEVV